jgi:hypothetical protein
MKHLSEKLGTDYNVRAEDEEDTDKELVQQKGFEVVVSLDPEITEQASEQLMVSIAIGIRIMFPKRKYNIGEKRLVVGTVSDALTCSIPIYRYGTEEESDKSFVTDAARDDRIIETANFTNDETRPDQGFVSTFYTLYTER